MHTTIRDIPHTFYGRPYTVYPTKHIHPHSTPPKHSTTKYQPHPIHNYCQTHKKNTENTKI